MTQQLEATKTIHLSLDEPIEDLSVEDRYRQVLLVVTLGGSVVGQVWLPGVSLYPARTLARLIAAEIGERIWRRELRESILLAGRGPEPEPPASPDVSVVVCTRNRADQLRTCLESLGALRTRPPEIVVVDNAPSDGGTKELCADFPNVRYLLEPLPGQSRARNRGIVESSGELVAFTDDDCVVDPRWLDGLDRPFADPLVMAVTGYTAPLELETQAQRLFEAHGGFPKHFERRVFDGAFGSPATSGNLVGAGANMIFRREVFEEIGLFAEDLGPGTPARAADDTYQMYKLLAAAYRVEYDPARIVWHRHRRDQTSLRRILYDYGRASTAYAIRLLIRHREPAALRLLTWWIKHSVAELLAALRNPDWFPLRTALAEGHGVLSGPWGLSRSRSSRNGIPAVELPEAGEPTVSPAVLVTEETPTLSVVIPSRNRSTQLRKLLESLGRQSYPPERFEAVVVLDGSEDDSGEMVRHLDRPYALTLLEQECVGAAASRNRGTRAASSTHVLFLDDDIVPERDLLAAHALAHAGMPDERLVLGRCPPVISGAGLWGQALRAWWEDHYRSKAEPGHRWTFMDFDAGNASFDRALFLETGGFDEDFRGRGREDWELGIRLLERGVRFSYHPDAIGLHYLDTRLETNLRHQRLHGCSDVLLAEKHPRVGGQLRFAAFLPGLPETSEGLSRYGPRLARLLDAAHLRGRWWRLVNRMLVNAYVFGLRDAIPSGKRLEAFSASMENVERLAALPLPLAHPGPLVLPEGGQVELAVKIAGISLRSVVADGPGEDWRWEVVADRVLDGICEPARAAALLEELARPPGAGRAAATELVGAR